MVRRRLVIAGAMLWVACGAGAAAPPSPASLFSSYDVITLRLTAPFNELFQRAAVAEDHSVIGTLGYPAGGQEKTIDKVEISLRGHTSRAAAECTFPKLKLRFTTESALQGSPFAGTSSLKIGTHCGEASDETVTAKYGRLPNEHSPHREAFVYRLLETVGVPALKARPARVTYAYTDARPGLTPDQQQPIARNALLLENTDDAVARLGGNREIPETAFTSAHDQFTVADTAAIAFAEAMIGNFDWCLKMTPRDTYRCNARHPLWNIIAVAGSSGPARPVLYDFDVSGMVAGRHRWFGDVYNETFVASRSHQTIEVLGQVQRTRLLFDRPVLDAARARFMQKKPAAYAALAAASMDAAGKRLAQQYLDSFFDAIGSDESFYRPVVVAQDTLPYADAAGAKAVCPAQGAIPVGTPVSAPLQTSGEMVQVTLLDVTWHWAPPAKCAEVHEGAVWINSSAVSRNFPNAANTK